MNTTRLKSFAAEARVTLKRGVMNRILALGFDEQGNAVEVPQPIEGGAVFMGETQSQDFYNKWLALSARIALKGLREVLEEAAYTWFNRFMAIRIMQMNRLIDPVLDYRSDSVRLPILLTDAMRGALPAMPVADRDRLLSLLNDPTRTAEQFALLITAFCHNTPVIDRCFGKIADYTELLLPSDILEENGFLDRLNHTDFVAKDDYETPELIGWLYQFYISERKDEVFAKKGKYTPDEIPAATQIFTPNWIVKYMVQNTVGRIWLDNNPYDDELKAKWRYLVDTDEQGEHLVIDDLAELKVADLACGSGHILNECFDLLLDLYVSSGYSQRQAIESIFKNNLTGIDLDTRAKQLATFALLLKACQKDEQFKDAHVMPRVLDMPAKFSLTALTLGEVTELNDPKELHRQVTRNINNAVREYLVSANDARVKEVADALWLFENCDSLGSIMKFDISDSTRYAIQQMTDEWKAKADRGDTLPRSVKLLMPYFDVMLALTEKYSALVMNPPYMGSGAMGSVLSQYVKDHYEQGKADLFSTFMILAIDRLADCGKYGMINMHSWMFLSSFERLRGTMLEQQTIDSLLHLGARTFDELSGEVVQNAAYVITKATPDNANGTYFRLVDGRDCADKERMFLDALAKHTKGVFYHNVEQTNFKLIPSITIAYWISEKVFSIISSNIKLGQVAEPRAGLQTSDNNRFLRYWFEVDNMKIGLDLDRQTALSSLFKWFPHNKGGETRKWFGNRDLVINFENDGEELKYWLEHNPNDPTTKSWSRNLRNYPLYFNEGITWGAMSNTISVRFSPQGSTFDTSGPMLFASEKIKYFLGLTNSCVFSHFVQIFSQGLSKGSGHFANVPYLSPQNTEFIEEIVNQNIKISREDWDAHETSWDFKENEFIRLSRIIQYGAAWQGEEVKMKTMSLDMIAASYKAIWQDKFKQLHDNEEELNRQFIDIYGLQDELSPDVPLDEVTILQQGEISIENGEIVWHDDVLMKQLISYAVGCWMGRYRLDKPGLHIAHTDATSEEKAPYEYNGEQFLIDDDGIIPLMPKDSMFADNAAHRFEDFIRQVFGEPSQVANLNFIEAALGMKLEQYFIKQFWKDHKKMYQNRPIYWLFSSKKGAFQCIAYMHRMDKYTPEIVRQKYLLPHMDDLRKRIDELQRRAADLNTQERRTLDSLQKQLDECMEYHDRLHPVADRQIDFDLDDGVLVNYAKFGDILAKLK